MKFSISVQISSLPTGHYTGYQQITLFSALYGNNMRCQAPWRSKFYEQLPRLKNDDELILTSMVHALLVQYISPHIQRVLAGYNCMHQTVLLSNDK